jgi:hypothetical protein
MQPVRAGSTALIALGHIRCVLHSCHRLGSPQRIECGRTACQVIRAHGHHVRIVFVPIILSARQRLLLLLLSRMNPLGLNPKRFMVACDEAHDGELVGFGQLKDLDDKRAELRSLYVNSCHRRARTTLVRCEISAAVAECQRTAAVVRQGQAGQW